MRYLIFIIALFAALQTNAQNNIVYGAGINYTNGAPTFTPPVRTSRVAIDTVTGKWYHFNTPGGWQLIGNTIEEIAGCTAPAYTPGKGDSKVVINNCSPQPELYFYNGSAWVLVGGGSVYAGEGIRIENDTIILDSLYILRFRTGSNTDGAAGAMSWNATEETVDLVTDQGAVTGHLMESAYYNTRNTTGSSIVVGTVVMANGTTGNTGRILIVPAIANGTVNSEYILGLAAQTIGNNSNGKVQHFGKIRGIQTNGANYGETWVDGDVLYCSSATPGYLTKVLPTAPNLKVPIAIVIHAHPSNGTLFVRPSHFPDLAQINDVQLSSPTNGQVLTYNSTLSRWDNATPANQLQTLSTDNTPGNISISSGNTITLNVNDADASATNELQTLSTGTNTLTLSNGGGTVTVDTDPSTDVTGSGAAGQVSFWTGTQTQSGSSNLLWTNASNFFRVNGGIGVNRDPFGGRAVDITGGGIRLTGSTSGSFEVNGGNSSFNVTTTGGNESILLTDGTRARISMTGNSYKYEFQVDDVRFRIRDRTVGDLDRLTILANGLVGISAATPAARLHVVGSGASSTTWTAQFHNSAGNNNALMIRDDGRIGIGTNSPTAKLFVKSTGNSSSTTSAFSIENSQAVTPLNLMTVLENGNVGLGGQTSPAYRLDILGGLRLGTSTVQFGFGESGGNSIFLGSLTNHPYRFIVNTNEVARFTTGSNFLLGNTTGTARLHVVGSGTSSTTWTAQFHNSAGNNNALMVRDDGAIGIGTNAPNASAILTITSTTGGILFPRMTTTERNAIATPADGLVIYNTTDNKLQVRAAGAWVDLH